MTLPMILAPLFALVLMTLIIGIVLASRRTPLLLGGKVREQDISLRLSTFSPRRRSRK